MSERSELIPCIYIYRAIYMLMHLEWFMDIDSVIKKAHYDEPPQLI